MKIKKEVGNFLMLILLVVIINTTAILSGFFGWNLQFLIVGVVFFAGGIFHRRINIKGWIYYIVLLIPFILIYDYIVIKDKLTHVYPIAFLPFLSLFFGMFLNKIKSIKVVFVVILAYLIFLVVSWRVLIPNYINIIFYPDNIEKIREPEKFKMDLITINKEKADFITFDNKIVVMDFWTTSCKYCFLSFSDFEELMQHYSYSNDIVFYAVCRMAPGQSIDKVIGKANGLKYNFPFLFAPNDSLNNSFFSRYAPKVPSIIIIDKKQNIVYCGEGGAVYDKYIYNNVYRTIDNLVKINK
jgi:thiol-disulfide isomerase/thioredoxin